MSEAIENANSEEIQDNNILNDEVVDDNKVENVQESNQKDDDLFNIEKYDFDFNWDELQSVDDNYKEKMKNMLSDYKKMSSEKKIDPQLSRELFDFHHSKNLDMVKENTTKMNDLKKSVANELNNEYGDLYGKKMDFFENGLEKFFNGDKKLVDSFKNICAFDKGAMKSFIRYGEKLNNKVVVNKVKSNVSSALSDEQIKSKLIEIQKNPGFFNEGHSDHKELRKEYYELLNITKQG